MGAVGAVLCCCVRGVRLQMVCKDGRRRRMYSPWTSLGEKASRARYADESGHAAGRREPD